MSSLNFIILKVNGRDVSQLAHEDAVAEFLRATEPILVEVKRRNDLPVSSSLSTLPPESTATAAECQLTGEPPTAGLDLIPNSADSVNKFRATQSTTSVACQTEPLGVAMCACGEYEDDGAPSANIVGPGGSVPFLLDSPANSCDDELLACHLFNDCLNPAIDIEEVTLQKANEDDYIGLTVSYSSGNGSTGGAVFSSSEDTDGAGTEVYISCILPDSVAGRDGRLRQGDQILQVNGRDVSTRDETEQLFAQDRNAVTLLVSRCLLYGDVVGEDGDDEPHQQHGVDGGCFEENDNELDDEDDDLLIATYQNCQQATSKAHSHLQLITQCLPIDTTTGLDHSSIKAHLDSVNMEISALDTRMENLLLHKSARCRDTVDVPDDSVYRNPIDATLTTTSNGCHTNTKARLQQHTQGSGRSHHHNQQQSLSQLPSGVSTTRSVAQRQPHPFKNRPPPSIDSSTEHIYETIPEERDDQEPIYCSPYYSQDDHVPFRPHKHNDGHLVEQWLRQNHQIPATRNHSGHKSSNRNSASKSISLPRDSSAAAAAAQSLAAVTAAATTVARATTSSTEDPDNSSSAYQTGGSCNSTNNATPLTLELTHHGHLHSSQSTLVLNTPASSSATLLAPQHANTTRRRSSNTNNNTTRHHHQMQPNSRTMLRPHNHHHSNLPAAAAQPYTAYPSTMMHNFQSQFHTTQKPQPHPTAYYYSSANAQQPLPPTNNDPSASTLPNAETMYTNMANLQQTMLLQQRLFRQAMAGRQQSVVPDPHAISQTNKFTAPSLSQYQFVSGQQQQQQQQSNSFPVTNTTTFANRELPTVPGSSNQNQQSHPPHQRMEWKVKRRQDGTRYIVRRPVRSDRSAAIRAHVESLAAAAAGGGGGGIGGGATTTEDDTMSEVKIGRYWTKEERKRHYEKSRERRAAAAAAAASTVAVQKQELSAVYNKNDVIVDPASTVNGDSVVESTVESNNNTNHRSKTATAASITPIIEPLTSTIVDPTNPATTPTSPQAVAPSTTSVSSSLTGDATTTTAAAAVSTPDGVAFPAGPADEIAAQLAAARLLSVTTV